MPKNEDEPTLDAAIAKLFEVSANRDLLSRESVPDDSALQQVWTAWNSISGDLTADERRQLLSGNPEARRTWLGWRGKLRKFPGYPFRTAAVASLRAAWVWSRFIEDLHNTRQNHSDLMAELWTFGRADHAQAGRLAIFRAGLELDALNPEFLKSTCPTVAQIERAIARRDAYQAARAEAHRRLTLNLASGLTLVPGRCDRRPPWSFAVSIDPTGESVRYFKESDLIARLESLSICSPRRLEQFLKTKLPDLPHSERQSFYRLALQTRRGNDRLLLLQVWLADNAPVIRQFRLRPADLWDQANLRKIPNCSRPGELAKLRNRWGLSFQFERGIPDAEITKLRQSGLPLLSPAPRFSGLFQDPSR